MGREYYKDKLINFDLKSENVKKYQPESAVGAIDNLGGIDAIVQYLEGKLFFKARIDKRDFMKLHNPRSTQNIYNSLGKLYKFFESGLGIFERKGESQRPMYIKLDGATKKLRIWYGEHKNNGHLCKAVGGSKNN